MGMLSSHQFQHVANGLLATTMAATVGMGGLASHQQYEAEIPGFGGPGTSQVQLPGPGWDKPDNIPNWTHQTAEQFPGFHNIENKPAHVIPNRVVVENLGGQNRTMNFHQAWQDVHDKPSYNDVWTLGYK